MLFRKTNVVHPLVLMCASVCWPNYILTRVKSKLSGLPRKCDGGMNVLQYTTLDQHDGAEVRDKSL